MTIQRQLCFASTAMTVVLLCLSRATKSSHCFSTAPPVARRVCRVPIGGDKYRPRSLLMSVDDKKSNGPQREYSTEMRLREEAESPFRKVRFLAYATLIGGALTSLAVSVARIAAALARVNADLMQESLTNAVVDVVGIVVLAYLFKRDVDAQESRLKRAAKGADFARLSVRGTAALMGNPDEGGGATASNGQVTTQLSAMRRGRGVDKRVVIAAAGKEKITRVLEQVRTMRDSLIASDLLIVPVVTPQYTAPLGLDVSLIEQDCVALPAGGNWKNVVGDEAADAAGQGVDVDGEGFCIVLKKNGRVGQRTRGIFLGRMVGEVTGRSEMGLDVKNI